jgi:DNA-binding NarL/FixJ family response regulator/class 3 adenylate cyclase
MRDNRCVPATTTILFTDLVSSTEALDRLGDDAGVREITSHFALVRREIEANGGRVAKTLGDGIMALFDSAFDAVSSAIAVHQHVERARRDSSITTGLRIGINVGEVLAENDDIFGAAVVVARRLCDLAAEGEIIVSDLVRMLVGSRGNFVFSPLGRVALKGLETPVEAATVAWQPLPDQAPVRVVIADDAVLIRDGIESLLAADGFAIVGKASDYDGLLAAVDATDPDLVITDIRMPPTNTDEGLRATRRIRETKPQIRVMLLSSYVEAQAAAELFEGSEGGVGYLLKQRIADIDEFLQAARLIAAGGSVVDPTVTEELLRGPSDSPLQRLTGPERGVLDLMAQGKSNQSIAKTLSIGAETVESHVRSILTKLDLPENPEEHRRVQAVIRWLDAQR